MEGKYIKINLDVLKDMDCLLSVEAEWNKIIINGYGRGMKIRYEASLEKAKKIGIIEDNICKLLDHE